MFACSGISRVPAPRPIDSIVIGGNEVEPLDDGRQDRGAGGRGQLALDHRLGQRHAAEQLGRGRGRQGHPPVSRLDPARGPGGTGLASNRSTPSRSRPDRRADDIDDRIDRADLVEVDLRQVDPVHPRLGLAQLQEDPLGQVLLPRRQDALVDDRLDVVPVAMGVLVRRDDLGIGGPEAAAADRLEASARTAGRGWRRPPGSRRRSTPASTSAASVMSPAMPLKQSK